MNKKFFVKLIQAKKLECEALYELLPECIQKKVKKAGREAVDVVKEAFFNSGRHDMEDGGRQGFKKIDIE